MSIELPALVLWFFTCIVFKVPCSAQSYFKSQEN